jgi:DNA-binding MurR/RpiR family transcriptional regulator
MVTAKKSGPHKTANSMTALESRFNVARSRLGPQRQKLIRSVLDNSEQTCFLSSRELGKLYDVDAATIVRAVQALGYSGFADFTFDLRQHFLAHITPYTALKAATREKRSVADLVDHGLDKSLDNINALRSDLDRNRVVEFAKLIHRSEKILVVAADFAFSLAHHLAYGLIVLGIDAESPPGSEGNLLHKVKLLTNKDLLIAISFGQCLRVTVESLQKATAQGVPTFGITDSSTTPIARYSDNHFIVASVSPSFMNTYAAPMALLNAILIACAHVDPKRSLTQLKSTNREYLSGMRWYRERKLPQKRRD